MISAVDLSRKYGEFTAVDHVSFEIPEGQIVGLLGHNGAGKTTILRMLTGYLEPTTGKVTIDGKDLFEDRLSAQKKLGYLPEDCPLYPEMQVLESLEYAARLRGIAKEEILSAIRNAIRKTGLENKSFEKVGILSKGYRQRVGIAQAILHRPEVLILDEPTNGLDPSQIFEMRTLIRELARTTTIILSTHILQEVEAVSDRVIILFQGRIAKDALLSELKGSRRLLVGLNQGIERSLAVLGEIPGVRSVELTGHDGSFHLYRIELGETMEQVTPLIAQAVFKKGWKLSRLEADRRNLETVFREVSEGNHSDE